MAPGLADFSYSSVQLNRNVELPLHVDVDIIGISVVLSGGCYTGGEFLLGDSPNIFLCAFAPSCVPGVLLCSHTPIKSRPSQRAPSIAENPRSRLYQAQIRAFLDGCGNTRTPAPVEPRIILVHAFSFVWVPRATRFRSWLPASVSRNTRK